jgi:adenylate cyclase
MAAASARVNAQRNFKPLLLRFGAGSVLASLLGLLAVNLDHDLVLRQLVWPSYDLPFRLRHGPPLTNVVMVYMDDDSHRELNQPYNTSWDRAVHARLLDRLTADGARAVVFDIVFSDPHPTNPAGDAQFARAIKDSGRVILGAEYTYTADGFPTVFRAIDPLIDAAAGWGFVQLLSDQDLTVRRHLHVPPDKDAEGFSSMTWQTAAFLGAEVARNPAGRFTERWMNYYGPPGIIPGVSFHRALETGPACPAGFFSNKVVFVGANLKTYFSGQRKDEFKTPYTRGGQFLAGVDVQATQFLNLVRGDWLVRLSPGMEGVLLMLTGLLLGVGLALLRPLPATGAALGAALVVAVAAHYLFWQHRIWFAWMIVILVQVPVALLWSVIFNSISAYIQNRLLEDSLSQYLSPALVRRMLKDPDLRKPGGTRQVVSILFSDIAGFSRVSEQISPEELIQLLNEYYETTIRCIKETEGIVVDIIGDAIFAIWNAPEPQPDHQQRMLRAALMFQQRLTEFHRRPGRQALRTRVGLHTGEVVVGNVGSRDHYDFTAIGENVNLASRLEGLNKHLGTTVLLSGAAAGAAASGGLTRRVGRFRFKGFDKAVEVHELVVTDQSAEQARPWLAAFEEGLTRFQQGNFAAAEQCFFRVLEMRRDDGPARFYLKEIEERREAAPRPGWDGTVELKEK